MPRMILALFSFVLLSAALLPTLALGSAALHHEMNVALDPLTRQLRVDDRIRVPAQQEFVLRLDARFEFEHILVDGRRVSASKGQGAAAELWLLRVRAPNDRAVVIETRYSGELDAMNSALDHREVLGLTRPVAGTDGAFLFASMPWYLHADHALVTYRVQVSVPSGYRAVASGNVVHAAQIADGFATQIETTDPLPGIDVLVGPYHVDERKVLLPSGREVRVRTYFHAELGELAAQYLDSAAGYLTRYDREIGAYAFASYNIVSSPLPTGFGMPGIAYLGRQVLRLPFIRSTSLGHEVLHDWWGNGVFPDIARGNWSEGLTTFLADYAYREDAGAGQAQAMRRAWLRDFAAVQPEHDRALTSFVARRHGADQVLGYNKTAFVFYMLRAQIGDQPFRDALRRFWAQYRFRNASWDDLRVSFEATAQRDLKGFFAQWTTRPGAPKIEIASAKRALRDGEHRLMLELRQAAVPYQLNVPLRIYFDDGASVDTEVAMQSERQQLGLSVPRRALSVAIDPEAHLFRRLDAAEIPPILRQLLIDRRVALVQASSDRATQEAARALAAATLEHAPLDWQAANVSASVPLLIIGLHADVERFLMQHALPPAPKQLLAHGGSAFAYAQRSEDGKSYAVVSARDSKALSDAIRSLPHLGAQSYVVLEGARSIDRGVWPSEPRRYAVTD